MRKPREQDLIRAVLELLRHRKIPCWRANAGGGLRPGRGGVLRPVRANPEGTADVLAVLPPSGRLLGIECKSPTGRVRAAQAAWIDSVNRAGGLAIVCRDLAELDRLLYEVLGK